MTLTKMILSAAVIFGLVATATLWLAEARYRGPDPSAQGEHTSVLQVMNEDQFKGKWKQFKGDLKQAVTKSSKAKCKSGMETGRNR